MSVFWSQGDRDAQLIRLWREGMPLRDIVARFGVSHGSVQRRIRTLQQPLQQPLRQAPAVKREGEWPDADEARLRALWMQDKPVLSAADIGRVMSRTKNSVVAKAHRMGLPERESPIARPVEGEEAVAKTPWQVARDAAGLSPLPAGHAIAMAVLEEARRLDL